MNILVLIAALSFGVIALSAEAMPEIELGGKARLRYEDTQGYNGTTFQRNGFWSVRLRPTLTVKADEHAQLIIEPQFAKVLGRDYAYTQSDSSGMTVYNENFHMHQGYLNLRFSDEFKIRGGRVALDYGTAAVIGYADWGTFGRAFDGVMLSFKDDVVAIDLAQLKIDSTPGTIDADKDLALLYSSWNITEVLKAFDLYGLYESNRASGANDYRHTLGARAKVDLSGFDASIEYAQEKGSAVYIAADQTGSMVIGDVGYSFPDLMKLRVGLEFDQANEHWREWYPTTKAQLGRNDVVGRRNLTAYALRTKASVNSKLALNLDYWVYSRTSTAASAYRIADATTVGTIAGSSSSDIGNSVELSAKYQISEKVEYGIGAAMFSQGAYLKDQFGDRTMTDFYAMASVVF